MSTVPDRASPATDIVRPGEAARVAGPDEGISIEELRLAARNHGMPLEALRYDLTPPGLHYLLVHYDIPDVEPSTYRLRIGGHVHRTIELELTELADHDRVEHTVTLECAGNGRARLAPRPVSQPWLDEAVGTACWGGVPLAGLLHQAGVRDGAVDVLFTGLDHGLERGVEQDYARALPLAEALRPEVLLADRMNGLPLPPQHGAPVRLIAPGWYGMAQVKWLREITVLDRPYSGFQNAVAYRFKRRADDAGEPVTRIAPRALVIPPGFPDFMTRRRIVDAGRVVLRGRAWSGRAPVLRVEWSTDGGASWSDAALAPEAERFAWRAWSADWIAGPGEYELLVRATDAQGSQPVEQPWNVQGMANNMGQRVAVTVR